MASLEETMEAACAAKDIPGAVLVATDATGDFHYEKAFGPFSLKEAPSHKPLEPDAMMWMASCTKLMTAVAVLQCVERGQLKLDEDVTSILHEYKDIDIITGFDDSGKPILKKASNKITLRQLLTHTSGISYGPFNPVIQKWRASQGQAPDYGRTIQERYLCPLLFEPGTSWEYSPGPDWAGQMVERVNGGTKLESYMTTHVWEPLGIKSMTFHIDTKEDLKKRMADMGVRSGTGKIIYTENRIIDDPVADDRGGEGIYGCATEYLKILQSLLADDEKLLKKESVNELFRPHTLGESSLKALRRFIEPQFPSAGTLTDYALGGLLLQSDMPNNRRKGTMSWGGLPNLKWWIDREGGLCGLYACQMLPPEDAKAIEMTWLFEATMYERYTKSGEQA